MWALIQKRKYAYWFSGVLTVLGILALLTWGLRLSIDFKGGTLMEVQFAEGKVPQVAQAQTSLEALGLHSLTIQPTGERKMSIRYLASDENLNEQVLTELKKFDDNAELVQVNFVGASVSNQIKQDAIKALLTAIIGIALYIAWAFRKVSYPVSSWYYGIMANVALFHDLVITMGIFSVLGHFFGVEIGASFIAALLTILGFSVHDTIVVYDRVRENLTRSRAKENFENIVNRSLNDTIARSFNTSFTVIMVLLAITIYGGESIKYFSLALLIGVAAGTYSSIYVASALLVTGYMWKQKQENKS
jgi:preprotein translocase subunit SecF